MKLQDFNFSGKRVRYQGRALSRFDIGQILDELRPNMCWTVSYDLYYYDDLVYYLKLYLPTA